MGFAQNALPIVVIDPVEPVVTEYHPTEPPIGKAGKVPGVTFAELTLRK